RAGEPGAQGHRCREGKGDPGAAARGGRAVHRRGVARDRGESRYRREPQARDRIPREPQQDGEEEVKSVTIARNYAEALFAAGAQFGDVLDAVAGAIQADGRRAVVLESPRVCEAAKSELVERAGKGEAPREVVGL